MTLNTEYANNILAIANELAEHKIPHTIHPLYNGLQMRFPWTKGDIVCHGFSYGCNHHCVESYNFPWDKEHEDDDVTCLTIEDALLKIVELYMKTIPLEEVVAMLTNELKNMT